MFVRIKMVSIWREPICGRKNIKTKTMKLTSVGVVFVWLYLVMGFTVCTCCESNGGSIRILNTLFICSEITIKCESNC